MSDDREAIDAAKMKELLAKAVASGDVIAMQEKIKEILNDLAKPVVVKR